MVLQGRDDRLWRTGSVRRGVIPAYGSYQNVYKPPEWWVAEKKVLRAQALGGLTQAGKTGASKMLYGWIDKFSRNFGKSGVGKGILFGVGAFAFAGANQLVKGSKWKSVDRPSSLRSGPGYISWSKSSGMPADNLSTAGLGLSLSKMRHTSVL